jgi:ketosteroid isomerase-like protein
MSEEDIAVVREQFEAVNSRDFPRAMDLYADDVRLFASHESGPKAGVYEGKEAVGEWFGDWFRSFAPGYRFEIQEARELDGGVIFLFATHAGRGRVSGVEVRGETAYLYRVLAGKVSQVGFFSGREEALEAVSLPEWSEAKTD